MNSKEIIGKEFALDLGSTPVQIVVKNITKDKVIVEYLNSTPGRVEEFNVPDFEYLAMVKITNKELCDCGKVAVWDYMPGYSGGGNSYSCDDCVPRGCSCNYRYRELPDKEDYPFKWIDDKTWVSVDEQGREYPCAEYWYSEEGWEVDDAD